MYDLFGFDCPLGADCRWAYLFVGDIIAVLLANRFISPNAIYPPECGTTPLHLAASEGRVDVVNLLLDQEEIDDSLLDANGKSCKDVAKGKGVVKAIQGVCSPELLRGTPGNETSVGYCRSHQFRLSFVPRRLIPFTPPVLHLFSFTNNAQITQPSTFVQAPDRPPLLPKDQACRPELY